MRCPGCKKSFSSAPTEALPFCSVRCQQIDLGRWLGEEYAVPVSGDDESSDELDAPPRPEDDEF